MGNWHRATRNSLPVSLLTATHSPERTAKRSSSILSRPILTLTSWCRGKTVRFLKNDDYEGDQNRSLLRFTLPENGEYTINATSFYPEESGEYVLVYMLSEGTDDTVEPITRRGSLEHDDDRLPSGAYVDAYDSVCRELETEILRLQATADAIERAEAENGCEP